MTKRDEDEAEQGEAEGAEEAAEPSAQKPEARDEGDEDEDDEPASRKPEPQQRATTSATIPAARRAKRAAPARSAASSSVPVARVALFLVVALAAGGAGGWFGHEAQAKARIQAESAAAPAGSGAAPGPCGAWQKRICDSGGATSAACSQAKGAVELLTASGCEAALGAMPATLAKLKAARAPCDTLVSKLCKDLPPGSPACTLVQDKTPSFPGERCTEMLQHYDEVLGSLRELDQQGGPPMGGPGAPGHP